MSMHHVEKITGVGDPQCFEGEAGKPRFKEGDRVRIKDRPDIFYTRCQMFTRGAIGEVAVVTHESVPPEDEAWENEQAPAEWFYIVRFRMQDLWGDYPSTYPNDTLQTEFSERWLEPA
ncbi:MAG TPA: SH3-like domain-containing protein [Gammaproteobacteria bacterium]|nr:SH3-like domain-containing protein [Gammaproteobacteria bacterium]